jgi:hypothetical protein
MSFNIIIDEPREQIILVDVLAYHKADHAC